jgi:hypothetical protein
MDNLQLAKKLIEGQLLVTVLGQLLAAALFYFGNLQSGDYAQIAWMIPGFFVAGKAFEYKFGATGTTITTTSDK